MQCTLRLTTLLISLSVLAPAAVAQTAPSAEQIRKLDALSEAEWYYSVGVQNYVFAFPLTDLPARAGDTAPSRGDG